MTKARRLAQRQAALPMLRKMARHPWSDRLHDRRHRWVEVAAFKRYTWHACLGCGLWSRKLTAEGRRRMGLIITRVTRRAFIPRLIAQMMRPSPIMAALLTRRVTTLGGGGSFVVVPLSAAKATE